MNKKTFIVAMAALISSGCQLRSQIPIAESYPYTTQKKMQAAHHWEVLANDVAKRIATLLRSEGLDERSLSVACSERGCMATGSEYRIGRDNTPFSRTFRDLLLTGLVNEGINVHDGTHGELVLEFNSQLIQHHDRGYVRPRAGTYTAVAAGLWAVHDLANYATDHASDVGNLLALGVLSDVFSGHIADESNSEVVINVSLMSGHRYLLRRTGIYYINAPDSTHYVEPRPYTREIQLVDDPSN